MADFTNPTNDELLYTFAAKNGDTLTTKNGSKWIWQGGQWYPFAFGSESKVQNLTATLSDGEIGKQTLDVTSALSVVSASPLPDLSRVSSETCYLHIHPCTATAAARYGERGVYVPIDNAGNFYGMLWGVKGRSANTAASITATGIFAPALVTWHTDAAITKSAGWTNTTNTSTFSGAYRYATAAGSSMDLTVSGRQISLATYLSTNGGCAVVSIDGDYNKANRLPAFTAADLAAGKCRSEDVGRRYVQCYASGTVVDFIPLADGLTDGPHAVHLEATGTKMFPSSSDVRVYVEGFAGVAAGLVPGAANVHFIPQRYISAVETWSEHVYVPYWAPAGSTDYQFLGGIHGDGVTSKEAEVSLSVFVDGIDSTAAAIGSLTSGRLIYIDHSTTRAHKSALATPVLSLRRRYTAASKRQCPIMCVVDVTWSVAGTLREEYPVMMPLDRYSPLTRATTQTLEDWVRMGEWAIPIGRHDNTEIYLPARANTMIAQGYGITAWAALERADPEMSTVLGQYRFRYRDINDGSAKCYLLSASQASPVAVGDKSHFVVGWGANFD